MKKIISVLIGITFVAVLFSNININANQKNGSDIQLKNLEALACFDVELNGSWYATCCFPWTNTCCVIDLYTSVAGTYTLR
ncbi:MAG: NVEALA domain-containing protein [Prolixibacteraceae bacterium]|nr:NVEALA domain-containing protein [Prolixibacteraceae bacterium]